MIPCKKRCVKVSNYKCQICSFTNWIDTPVSPQGRPLQDWFCKKCHSKLFSLSFVNPAHPDTKSVQCSWCSKNTKFCHTPTNAGGQTSLICPSCSKSIMSLKVEGIAQSPIDTQRPIATSQRKNPPQTKNNDSIPKFLKKNWLMLGFAAVCIVIFMSSNSNTATNKTPRKSSYTATQSTQQNVYRGTKIAKQEFYKKSKSERLRIQKFLKDNFGYTSTLDGLWGPQTANSFIRAANRYARNVSLYSAPNVNRVFNTALSQQKSTPRAQVAAKKKNEVKPEEQIGKAIETILMLGAAKALLGGGSNSGTKTIIPLMNNTGPSYSYGNNGNTIYHPGGKSKFSYGSNGSVYYNPGSCPVKPCN